MRRMDRLIGLGFIFKPMITMERVTRVDQKEREITILCQYNIGI